MSKFAIQTYGKSEFAMLMFPDIDNPKVAQNKLLDPEFHQKLKALSSSVGRNDYSADQIKLMIDKWGAPGEYEL